MKKLFLITVMISGLCTVGCRKEKMGIETALPEHVMGDTTKADVIVVTYMSPSCPFSILFKNTMKHIVADNHGKVAWVYRHGLLEQLFPEDRLKMQTLECISDLRGPAMFWRGIDSLYNKKPVTTQSITLIASACGIDSVKFWSSINQSKYQTKIKADSIEFERADARGIPHSVLHNKRGQTAVIKGAYPIADVQDTISSLF